MTAQRTRFDVLSIAVQLSQCESQTFFPGNSFKAYSSNFFFSLKSKYAIQHILVLFGCFLLGFFSPLFFLKGNSTRPALVIDVNGIPGLEKPEMTCRYCM